MCPGADAQVVAEAPVIEVVPGASLGLRIGRGFVVRVAGAGEPGFDHGLHVGRQVVVRQWRRVLGEYRIGFEREVIDRQVLRRKCNRRLEIGSQFVRRLSRQRIHQVEVDVVECHARDCHRAARLVAVVNATERAQVLRVETLDADRQTVGTAGAIGGEALGLEGARVGLQGDLGVGFQRQAGANVRHQAIEAGRRHQARGAAADENGVHAPAPHQR